MVSARVIWFDRRKGLGEALDEKGRTLILTALEIRPLAKPIRLNPKDKILCSVQRSKSGYIAKQISKAEKIDKNRSADVTL